MKYLVYILLLALSTTFLFSQEHSVARKWNEVLLQSIRNDLARPTVHARNLFHTSVIAYDAWALFNEQATPYFLGKNLNGFYTPLDLEEDIDEYTSEQKDSISGIITHYATRKLLTYRFRNSPNQAKTQLLIDSLFLSADHDTPYTNEDYAALGNYLGTKMIEYGQQDGANDQNDYANLFYKAKKKPLIPAIAGNKTLKFVNHWQPLALEHFVDQSGNIIPKGSFTFLSPEWGYSKLIFLRNEKA